MIRSQMSATERTVVDLASGVVRIAAVKLSQRHTQRLRHEQGRQEDADRAEGGGPPATHSTVMSQAPKPDSLGLVNSWSCITSLAHGVPPRK